MSEPTCNIHTLKEQVKSITAQYLLDIEGYQADSMYQDLIDAVEESFLRTLLSHTQGNQKAAAAISGISRNTIRKKITKHNL
jgi:Fis family transcriptional regulator